MELCHLAETRHGGSLADNRPAFVSVKSTTLAWFAEGKD